MKQHQVYSIRDTDKFDAAYYSGISEEITFIVKQTAGMLPAYKEDIIISYLKDHSINNIWITANPMLARLVISNVLPSINIEALFEASRTNPAFRDQFESYFRSMFQTKVSS